MGPAARPALSALAAVDVRLGQGDDGKPLGPATAGRYRKVSKACIRRAAELGIISADPWPPAPRGRSKRKATRVKRSVPIRSLPSPEVMARVIEAIPSHQYVGALEGDEALANERIDAALS